MSLSLTNVVINIVEKSEMESGIQDLDLRIQERGWCSERNTDSFLRMCLL